MALATVNQETLTRKLLELGVAQGDGLLVHSALQFLGKPESGEGLYLKVLEELIGGEGTLAVPAFTFAFAKGDGFDLKNSPSVGMGSFSELVRKDPRSQRTSHPMQSLALLGKYAEELASLETSSAFDDGSAFERMLELDFKLLLLGADIQAASVVHYAEQRAAVPYRYWKEFAGEVSQNGQVREASYRMFVRDLEVDAQLELAPIQDALEQKSQWQSTKLNYGHLSLCTMRDFVSACDQLLEQDAWALVGNRASLQN